MSDFQKRLVAKRELTPKPGEGYNLVGVDTFEEPGAELYFIGHFATKAKAEAAKTARLRAGHPDEVLYIYGSER